jgi:alpha-mannosidase
LESIRIVEQGPVRVALEIVYRSPQSFLTQRLLLNQCQPLLEIQTIADWHEKRTLLKALFPVDLLSTRATYEIQFGNIERPTHRNTIWDAEKFEVCGQKWIDLSEGNYGVSLLNDCKYGHHVAQNVMGITLLRSPMFPELLTCDRINPYIEGHPDFSKFTDQGRHEFAYAIYPHQHDWRQAGTVAKAYDFNIPLKPVVTTAHAGEWPVQRSWIQIQPEGVILETVKPSEDGTNIVLRIYESYGTKTEARLQFDLPEVRIYETNLLEENPQACPVKNGVLVLTLKPFEIKTFVVK